MDTHGEEDAADTAIAILTEGLAQLQLQQQLEAVEVEVV
jgi:hypothetical protein